MEKREKIIVAITIAAALYGAVDFISKSPIPTSLIPTSDSGLDTSVSSQLTTLSITKSPGDAYLADRIDAAWPTDLFMLHKPQKPESSLTPDKSVMDFQFSPTDFSYSGYLEMADEKIAIINGLDYREGDTINSYTLKTISPEIIQLSRQGLTFNVAAANERKAGLSAQ